MVHRANTQNKKAGRTSSNVDVLLDCALRYLLRGWTVFPVKGKRPTGPWKSYQTVPPDDATLRRLFSHTDIDGIAVVLGSASNGLCCRDYDDKASYDRWAESHPQLASTLPTVETHRGRHVYFRGTPGFTKFVNGEYRGTPRQYTVLPPSRHPAGTTYRWVVPLPDGELPIIDPHQAGLCNREDKEDTADGEDTAHSSTLLLSSASALSSTPSLLQTVESAIVETLPRMQGERNRKLFELCRRLKALPHLASVEPAGLRPIVVEWYQRALPIISTKSFPDTWADFIHGWKKVKVPAGEGVIDTAFKRAEGSVPPQAATKLYGEGPILLLASLCRELQRISGDTEFYLDCRTAGRLIGVDHTTAWRYLDVLCADCILAAGAKGSKATSKASGRASRFRFINLEKGANEQ